MVEQVARRLLRDAFGSPSERTVALAPPLMVALSVAWVLGRASRSGASGGSGSSSCLVRVRNTWDIVGQMEHQNQLVWLH